MASRDETKKEDGQTAGGQERENAGGGSPVVGPGLGKGGEGWGQVGWAFPPPQVKANWAQAVPKTEGPQALAEQIVESGDRTRRQKAGSNSIPLVHAGQVLPFTFRIPRDKTEQG